MEGRQFKLIIQALQCCFYFGLGPIECRAFACPISLAVHPPLQRLPQQQRGVRATRSQAVQAANPKATLVHTWSPNSLSGEPMNESRLGRSDESREDVHKQPTKGRKKEEKEGEGETDGGVIRKEKERRGRRRRRRRRRGRRSLRRGEEKEGRGEERRGEERREKEEGEEG